MSGSTSRKLTCGPHWTKGGIAKEAVNEGMQQGLDGQLTHPKTAVGAAGAAAAGAASPRSALEAAAALLASAGGGDMTVPS